MKKWIGPILLLLIGILLTWAGISLVGDAVKLTFKGRGAEATVTTATFSGSRDNPHYVEFSFLSPEGAFNGFGNTYQAVARGSRLNVVYLPDDPTQCLPVDDPKRSPWFGLGLAVLGLLLFGGGGVVIADLVRRRRSPEAPA